MTFSGYSPDTVNKPARKEMSNSYHKETLEEVLELPCIAVPQQSIIEVDAEFYEIRSSVSGKDGLTVSATYFPYYNQEGYLTGFKKRDWTMQKEDEGHFSTVGSVKASNQLFGQHTCQFGGKKLIYVEGEGDCVAARRSILDGLKGTKWEGKISPNVVSLNTGAASAAVATAHNEDFIKAFQQVVIAFDNDEATVHEAKKGVRKGKEAMEDVAGYLLTDNLYTISWPKGMKDPRAMYDAGLGKEFADAVAFHAVKYSPEKIVSGDDAELDELIKPLREGIYLERYPKLMEKIKGLRTGGELITYAAFSGVGKSTLAREFTYELINAGETVGCIYLEEDRIKTQQALLCLELGIKLPEFRENPLAVATREDIAAAKAKILSNGRTFFLDHFGSLQVDKLITQMKYLHFICGCSHIVLDHVSMVIAGTESNNERKDIDSLYEALAAFVTVNAVTVHAICHLKRVDDSQARKIGADEEQKPYWREVRKEMLRGCVDKDTEFLSQDGWKKISDYKEGDKVFTPDENFVGGFSTPEDYIKLPCEEMYEFTNSSLNMVLSKEHKVPYRTERVKDRTQFIEAGDLFHKFEGSSSGFRGLIPQAFTVGGGVKLFESEDLLRLQVAVNADGSMAKRTTNTGYCRVRVKKERKKIRIRELLNKTGTKFIEFPVGDYDEFCFISPTKSKGITSEWYNLDQESLEVYAEELKYWDGELTSGRINSIDKLEADFNQFAYSAVFGRSGLGIIEAKKTLMPDGKGGQKGYQGKEQYRVGRSTAKLSSMRKDKNCSTTASKFISTDGMKYCFTTETGLWLARRNNKVFVTGNSSGIECMSSTIIMLENQILPDGTRGLIRTRVEKNREWSHLGICDTMTMLEDGRLYCIEEGTGEVPSGGMKPKGNPMLK